MSSPTNVRSPHWLAVPVRIFLWTLLFAALGFAVSLLLGLVGTIAWATLHGANPNLRAAYRDIALPAAGVVAVIALVVAVVKEVRYFRQAKALASIERVS